jgi:hypothetical protein
MRKATLIGAICLALCCIGQRADAQFFPGMGWYGWPWWGGVYPWFAGAAIAEGFGSLATGLGQYELNDSLAARNYQEAYRRWIDNQPDRVATYFELRRMNRSYRDAERRAAPTKEEIELFNRQRTPPHLTGAQLDPTSGRIHWPAILLAEEFAPQRSVLDELFMMRSRYPWSAGLGTTDYHEALAQIADMQWLLKAEIFDIRPDEFIWGNKFLKSLAYEARFVAGVDTRQTADTSRGRR